MIIKEAPKRQTTALRRRPLTFQPTMNTILNAFFVLARAQLVDPRPEPSASDPIDETGASVQLTTFRTHSAPDPIAEPLYEPPLVHSYSENEKFMMYGSTSSVVRGHFRGHCRGTSSVRFTRPLQVRVILRLKECRTRQYPSALPQHTSSPPSWRAPLHNPHISPTSCELVPTSRP